MCAMLFGKYDVQNMKKSWTIQKNLDTVYDLLKFNQFVNTSFIFSCTFFLIPKTQTIMIGGAAYLLLFLSILINNKTSDHNNDPPKLIFLILFYEYMLSSVIMRFTSEISSDTIFIFCTIFLFIYCLDSTQSAIFSETVQHKGKENNQIGLRLSDFLKRINLKRMKIYQKMIEIIIKVCMRSVQMIQRKTCVVFTHITNENRVGLLRFLSLIASKIWNRGPIILRDPIIFGILCCKSRMHVDTYYLFIILEFVQLVLSFRRLKILKNGFILRMHIFYKSSLISFRKILSKHISTYIYHNFSILSQILVHINDFIRIWLKSCVVQKSFSNYLQMIIRQTFLNFYAKNAIFSYIRNFLRILYQKMKSKTLEIIVSLVLFLSNQNIILNKNIKRQIDKINRKFPNLKYFLREIKETIVRNQQDISDYTKESKILFSRDGYKSFRALRLEDSYIYKVSRDIPTVGITAAVFSSILFSSRYSDEKYVCLLFTYKMIFFVILPKILNRFQIHTNIIFNVFTFLLVLTLTTYTNSILVYSYIIYNIIYSVVGVLICVILNTSRFD